MAEQEELIEEMAHIIDVAGLYDSGISPRELADQVFALIKKEYPIMYREEADFIGWLLKQGWVPPEEAKNYVRLADDQKLPKIVIDSHSRGIGCPCCGEEFGIEGEASQEQYEAQQDMLKQAGGK